MSNNLKIVQWVGSDMWLNTTNAHEIEFKLNDLILCDLDKITTGFMTEVLSASALNTLNQNTILYKWVLSLSEYQEIYSKDLEKRNPHAPVFATIDDGPTLSSSKARDVANRFGVTFSK